MLLLTKSIKAKLPKFYETEETATEDKVLQVKFFHPLSSWTWYGVEFDEEETILLNSYNLLLESLKSKLNL